ncbi:hypothetical protein [Agromyces arachidis]|uniref:hypothetical protein n=1 Tax=Agromyces arachidis TaxID=766966 RepID=UPI0040577EA4
MSTVIGSIHRTRVASVEAPDASARRHRAAYASIAHGTIRGYYRSLLESGPVDAATFAAIAGVGEREAQDWIAEQLAHGLLRAVRGPRGEAAVILPGEFVPILLDDRGQAEFAAARALLARHADALPASLRSLWPGAVDAGAGLRGAVHRLWARMFAA